MENKGGRELAIDVSNISKSYKDFLAVNNVSFQVIKNCIFGLLGSNGAGKSTTLHMLIGLINPSKGNITILGEKVEKNYSKLLKKKVAIVPQKISLYENLSIYDNLYFFGNAFNLEKKVLQERITTLQNILNLGKMDRKVKTLSGGYQRRVSLAVALIGDPEIIILDEALVGIDLETKKIIIDLLNELKKYKTIIITTHSISEAERLCDYMCFMHKGNKVLEGSVEDILKEYSSKQTTEILVTFKGNIDYKEFIEDISVLKIDYTIKENILNIKTKPGSNDVINTLTKIFDRYKGIIEDIKLNKPGLENLIFDLIK
ncbi:MAG: ABC transporter ATP-binding protein [Candidatus Pacearchaeota archaeon]|jgi:ABC-2 type transport system ATP-binding protein